MSECAPRSRVIAIANQKGGVGKTTTALNLGTALAAVEKRVLLIDCDPQGNASTGLGVASGRRTVTTYDVLIDRFPAAKAAMATAVPGLSLVPGDPDLAGVEVELGQAARRAFRLKDALAAVRRDGEYDIVLIDCPPSLNLLTLNALTAADGLLVPLQCEFFALEGLTQLLGTVERVRAGYNPDLVIQGIVLTMYDRRNSLSELVATDVRASFGATVYNTVIPRNVRVSEAPSFGKPALIYDLKCAGSQAYLELAREVLARERQAQPGGPLNPRGARDG